MASRASKRVRKTEVSKNIKGSDEPVNDVIDENEDVVTKKSKFQTPDFSIVVEHWFVTLLARVLTVVVDISQAN